jgi:hypothetical protein
MSVNNQRVIFRIASFHVRSEIWKGAKDWCFRQCLLLRLPQNLGSLPTAEKKRGKRDRTQPGSVLAKE